MSLLIPIFLFLTFLIILLRVLEYLKERRDSEYSEETEETQVTDQEEQQETKLSSRITMTIVVVVIAILVFALFNAWGVTNNEAKKIIRTDGSGDCEDEVYSDGIKISDVKSDSSVSFTSDQKIGRGKTNTLSFLHKGSGGNISLLVLPLKNLPENQVNPSSFEVIELTNGWTLYEISFCCPAECQFVVTLNVPEGCEGEIKDFKIE